MYKVSLAALGAALFLMVSGCNGMSSDVAGLHPAGPITGGGEKTKLGGSCEGQTGKLCLGLKYVVYEHQDGTPVVDEATVASNIAGINSVWKACGIAFQ